MSSKEVELAGGAPWGFRMHGGADHHQPLRISRRYSDSLERSLEVNPGRKASLSGIREGDVISSINGRPTKGITNAEAHALLRSAGPVLKLGLNEDREMSPRRRSIGMGSELKRPSELIADINGERATPQAPVYATIRASPLSQNKSSPPGLRSSLNSLPTALSSTPLVKSVAALEEPVRIHPTNPFYTTLPTNQHTSPSKLPIPNGRMSYSSLDRTKSLTNSRDQEVSQNEKGRLKSSVYFSKLDNKEPSSLPYDSYISKPPNQQTNGYTNNGRTTANDDKIDPFSYDSLFSQNISNGLPSRSNDELIDPFDTSRISSDIFGKHLSSNNEYGSKTLTNSVSDNSFHSKEIRRSTVTEHKINEIKELKTIKKIVLNGSGEDTNGRHEVDKSTKVNNSDFERVYYPDQHNTKSFTSSNEYSRDFSMFDKDFRTSPYFSQDDYKPTTSKAAEVPKDDVSSKPPLKSPTTPTAPAHPNPTPKREYQHYTQHLASALPVNSKSR